MIKRKETIYEIKVGKGLTDVSGKNIIDTLIIYTFEGSCFEINYKKAKNCKVGDKINVNVDL